MDPVANLKKQRQLALSIQATWDACNDDGALTSDLNADVSEQAIQLAELMIALDEWISKGGFSPWKEIR